jgi:hypothetical protein
MGVLTRNEGIMTAPSSEAQGKVLFYLPQVGCIEENGLILVSTWSGSQGKGQQKTG